MGDDSPPSRSLHYLSSRAEQLRKRLMADVEVGHRISLISGTVVDLVENARKIRACLNVDQDNLVLSTDSPERIVPIDKVALPDRWLVLIQEQVDREPNKSTRGTFRSRAKHAIWNLRFARLVLSFEHRIGSLLTPQPDAVPSPSKTQRDGRQGKGRTVMSARTPPQPAAQMLSHSGDGSTASSQRGLPQDMPGFAIGKLRTRRGQDAPVKDQARSATGSATGTTTDLAEGAMSNRSPRHEVSAINSGQQHPPSVPTVPLDLGSATSSMNNTTRTTFPDNRNVGGEYPKSSTRELIPAERDKDLMHAAPVATGGSPNVLEAVDGPAGTLQERIANACSEESGKAEQAVVPPRPEDVRIVREAQISYIRPEDGPAVLELRQAVERIWSEMTAAAVGASDGSADVQILTPAERGYRGKAPTPTLIRRLLTVARESMAPAGEASDPAPSLRDKCLPRSAAHLSRLDLPSAFARFFEVAPECLEDLVMRGLVNEPALDTYVADLMHRRKPKWTGKALDLSSISPALGEYMSKWKAHLS